MAIHSNTAELLRTISFWRRGSAPFDGKLYIRGGRFEDFLLESSVGRIPQDACDAVKLAKAFLQSGTPSSYEQAIEALNAVSSGVVADWP